MKESLKVYIIIYAIDMFFKVMDKHNFILKPFVMLEESNFKINSFNPSKNILILTFILYLVTGSHTEVHFLKMNSYFFKR